jgi:hypothetical protein
MANSSLQAIRTKVRRLTRSPSEAQLTTAQLDEYINTFVLYDFPEQIRTFNLHKQFTFYTTPLQDTYPTDVASFAGATTNPLYDFQNKYLTINPPVYISGYQSMYSQSQNQFYGIYPQVRSISSIGTSGDGATTNFSGVVNTSQAQPGNTQQQNYGLLQNHVLFESITSAGLGTSLVDVPIVDPASGNNFIVGNLYDPYSAAYQAALVTPPTTQFIAPFAPGTGTIDYFTGAFNFDFSAAPATGATINSQTVPQTLAIPQAILFYENKFVLRPVPDQVYTVNFEVYQRPVELLASGQIPELQEYWQYIAYGAAKKVFEDRMDTDSVQQIFPEFKTQERLVLRRTIVQITTQRTATIYTEQIGQTSGGWGFGNGGGAF